MGLVRFYMIPQSLVWWQITFHHHRQCDTTEPGVVTDHLPPPQTVWYKRAWCSDRSPSTTTDSVIPHSLVWWQITFHHHRQRDTTEPGVVTDHLPPPQTVWYDRAWCGDRSPSTTTDSVIPQSLVWWQITFHHRHWFWFIWPDSGGYVQTPPPTHTYTYTWPYTDIYGNVTLRSWWARQSIASPCWAILLGGWTELLQGKQLQQKNMTTRLII